MRLMDRDKELMVFLARYRFATYDQMAFALDINRDSLRRRLRKLHAQKLVEQHEVIVTPMKIWQVTADAVEFLGADRRAPLDMKPSTVTHTLGLTDLGIFFEKHGETVVTETEILIGDRTSKNMAALQYQADHGRPGPVRAAPSHTPDLILMPNFSGRARRAAIELELSRKPPRKLKQILALYRDADDVDVVVYYTDQPTVWRLIERAAAAVGATDKVMLRAWAPDARSGLTAR
ncbi:hypothetical protein HMPREF0063_10207 [Aeromicrobium marinum DSM 15272]|uniref:Uncharacterized protein n=2 Tax=Aeromicrobium marinum TaxID=219314 RepID=E2S850_9ACTN|nr:hypothetical protein HMPREF0063_10207 [Aeromicrobium marinum DSM 15272]